MNSTPISNDDRDSIVALQRQLDELRRSLNISDRASILFRSDLSYGDDDVVFVEADGLGGAILLVVEGNYPVDFFTREQRNFTTELAAITAAEALRTDSVA